MMKKNDNKEQKPLRLAIIEENFCNGTNICKMFQNIYQSLYPLKKCKIISCNDLLQDFIRTIKGEDDVLLNFKLHELLSTNVGRNYLIAYLQKECMNNLHNDLLIFTNVQDEEFITFLHSQMFHFIALEPNEEIQRYNLAIQLNEKTISREEEEIFIQKIKLPSVVEKPLLLENHLSNISCVTLLMKEYLDT